MTHRQENSIADAAISRRPTDPVRHLSGETAGHHVFLNAARHIGRAQAPEISLDPPGVNRRAIHDRAAAFAALHFRTALETAA
ncbi:hypothetical protein [Thalassobaculum sp.]|uniref:hypothetical protein n=1 Tax=Thalassobaculum sp. TaxID=2022740 RepID=UPI003B5BE730